ncbi:D-arabinono-1,4-lactone oxidase [Fangia hongkongensis]|uniref:D-arabinono-1,4-lactone oxidase n=1 Tax=Fangia hongkongensis TaxID=270495 RepID=UPI00037F365D|nr:D-arabinono-1,4-lactone oxidase [Fangia hongkongensis]
MRQTNWAENQIFEVERISYPKTLLEIKTLIQAAVKNKRIIRPVGKLHSWTPLCNDASILLNLSNMPDELCMLSSRHLKCSAGVEISKMADFLYQHDCSLPIMGDCSAQTIGGAVSTGTHGPSIYHQIVANNVTAIKFIDGKGETHSIDDKNPMFNAVRVSLGLMGVVTEIELSLVPAKHLQIEIQVQEDDEWIPFIEEDLQRHEFYFSYWYSHVNLALVHKGHTLETAVGSSISNTEPQDEYLTEVISSLCPAVYKSGVGAKEFNELLFKLFFRNQTIQGPLHKALVADWQGRPILNAEYFVPKEKARLIFEGAKAIDYPEPVFVAIRGGIKADDNWMSPAYKRDSVAIGCVVFCSPFGSEMPRSLRLFNDFMHQCDARPQWAKWCDHEHMDLSKHFPKLDDFLKLREHYDPHNVFLTSALRKILKVN